MNTSKTLDALLLAVGIAGIGSGIYETTRPRPPTYQLNVVERAGAEIALDTPEAVDYARKAIPGMAMYAVGAIAGLAGVLRLERRK